MPASKGCTAKATITVATHSSLGNAMHDEKIAEEHSTEQAAVKISAVVTTLSWAAFTPAVVVIMQTVCACCTVSPLSLLIMPERHH